MERLLPALRRFANLLFGVLALFGLYLTSLYSYLLFHVLAELFSVVVAWGIFTVAASSWQFQENEYLSFIGTAYLFVGGLDLVHTLAYKGMDLFAGYDANLPTQLWIAARYIESLSLLAAPLFLRRKLRPYLALFGYTVATTLVLLSIFGTRGFPDCYLEGVGLTTFKKISEVVISGILLLAILFMRRQRNEFDRTVFGALTASIALTIASELSFTFYVNVYGVFNLVGHLLKIVSRYLIYRAFVETGIVKPYDLLFRNLKQSEERLRSENEELDAFAHTVAHDLNSPLMLVMGFAELLQEGLSEMSDREIKHYLQEIVQGGRKMSSIVSDLMLLAGVRRRTVKIRPLDMSEIVAEALRRTEHSIKECDAEISVPETWPIACGYAPWVEEIWVNYVSNALKYGGRPPRVELGCDTQDDGMVRFWVRDNGRGISPENQARLFTPFTKLSQAHTEGHGLGLSIAMRIAEKLGGHVGVESEVGQGSTFSFTIPRAAS